MKKLFRSKNEKLISGVCGGIAGARQGAGFGQKNHGQSRHDLLL